MLIGANRDEMADRAWKPPGRHWPDRADVVAGLDELARGTWLGLNDAGVVAAVLNRINTLGPAPGYRSRGELPLEALDHADAESAAAALADLNPDAYRPFNMIVCDARRGYWVRLVGGGDGLDAAASRGVAVSALPDGLAMLTAYDLNDGRSPRMRRYLPLFREAAVPVPDSGDWRAWQALLAARDHDEASGPGGAMAVVTDSGFGTVSSSLIALPGDARKPVWLFAPGRPGHAPYEPIPV